MTLYIVSPSKAPSDAPIRTDSPSKQPSVAPTVTDSPSNQPSIAPTATNSPSTQPSTAPTRQREDIWYQEMNGAVDVSDWTSPAEALNPVTLISSTQEMQWCPFLNQPCWELCGQAVDSGEAYMYRIASTQGYKEIEFTYSIDPYSVNDYWQSCEIHFTLNGETDKNAWTLISSTETPERPVNQIYTFDHNADNNQVGIFLFSNTANSNDCCRIRRWRLTGIPLPTTSPTTDPSRTPSAAPTNDPSKAPTNDPSKVPSAAPTSPSNAPSTEPTQSLTSLEPITTLSSSYNSIVIRWYSF